MKKIKFDLSSYKKYIKYFLLEIVIVGLVIVADLLTKKYIYGKAATEGSFPFIKGFISFVSTENTGASFGMFGESTVALTVVSFVCSLALLIFLFYSVKQRNSLLRASLVMILGGSIGNLVDRFALGYVRDFINFDFMNFAIFNVADSALTIGTVLLMIYIIFFYKPDAKPKEKDKADSVVEPVTQTESIASVNESEEQEKHDDAQEIPVEISEQASDEATAEQKAESSEQE